MNPWHGVHIKRKQAYYSYLAIPKPSGLAFPGNKTDNELLAWIIIPFLSLNGAAPAGDDVAHFLDNFSQTAHPLVVSAAATLLVGIAVFLSAKKGVIGNCCREIKAMKA